MGCERCDDTGWKTVDTASGRAVERCDCWRQAVSQKLVADARIPPRYQRCTLDSFVSYQNEELLRAIASARRFCEAFPVVDKGLMLIGPPGIGKTHIAVAVLHDVVRRTGARGLYYDTRALLKDIRSTYNPVTHTAEMDVIRPVMEAELLVLDDLGADRPLGLRSLCRCGLTFLHGTPKVVRRRDSTRDGTSQASARRPPAAKRSVRPFAPLGARPPRAGARRRGPRPVGPFPGPSPSSVAKVRPYRLSPS